jgi:uncharacterized membrane protein YkvA (DUF1232 family)
MKTEQIRRLINEGKQIERQQGLLRQGVIGLANLNGTSLTEQQVQDAIAFITEYIEHAPALIDMIEQSAAAAGQSSVVQPIVGAAEDYFLSPHDLIPDHFGLLGLVDDAYLTHSLIQAMADKHETQTGQRLFPVDMHQMNAFFRNLVGEPFATMLDNHVATTLNGPSIEQNLQQFLGAMSQLNLAAGPDPIWGNASAAEIADVRLGAMGVV